MKKIILFILISAILASLLISCGNQGSESITNPWEDPALSERDATIRAISDVAVMQAYGLNAEDIYLYEITINTTNKGGYVVYYKLCFFGYDTYEHYWVNLSEDYTLEGVTSNELGVYSRFISLVTEKDVKNAEKKLDEKLKSYDPVSDKYMSVDDDGNLCLIVEVIEDIIPPLTDEYGNTEGCGLDHNHILITEIVYKANW